MTPYLETSAIRSLRSSGVSAWFCSAHCKTFNPFNDFSVKKKKEKTLGIASAAVATLQAGSVAVTQPYRSVGTKTCQSVMPQKLCGREATLTRAGFLSPFSFFFFSP